MKLKPTQTPLPQIYSRSNIYPVSVRFSSSERALLRDQAKEFAGGNLSEYIRYAALHFKPRKKDMVKK